MNRRLLIAYQFLTGLSDTFTGVLLIVAPALTLKLMGVHALPSALPYLSYIGAFVLSVGIACLYGGALAIKSAPADKLEVVWFLTAITRGLVALFVFSKVISGTLETGWSAVALSDGALAIIQLLGLAKGWLQNVRA